LSMKEEQDILIFHTMISNYKKQDKKFKLSCFMACETQINFKISYAEVAQSWQCYEHTEYTGYAGLILNNLNRTEELTVNFMFLCWYCSYDVHHFQKSKTAYRPQYHINTMYTKRRNPWKKLVLENG